MTTPLEVPPVEVAADVSRFLAMADADVAMAQTCERTACERGTRRGALLLRAACALRERANLWRTIARSYEEAVGLAAEARAALVVDDERTAADFDRLLRRELRR